MTSWARFETDPAKEFVTSKTLFIDGMLPTRPRRPPAAILRRRGLRDLSRHTRSTSGGRRRAPGRGLPAFPRRPEFLGGPQALETEGTDQRARTARSALRAGHPTELERE